jgi:heme-degrading monooxygenase HmoA
LVFQRKNMIKRLVKLTFQADKTAEFELIFEQSKNLIRQMAGCQHVELLHDVQNPTVYFTLSLWDSEADLEAYRQSELFRTTWAKTKVLFADRPAAWSTKVLSVGD